MEEMKPFLAKVAEGVPLSQQEASAAFDIILSGKRHACPDGGAVDGASPARRNR